jgi:hypothetical protein
MKEDAQSTTESGCSCETTSTATEGFEQEGLLEVEGDGGDGVTTKTVYCPRKARHLPLHDCLDCPRYKTLAIDPSGKHVYLDCDWVGTDEVRHL